VTTGSGNIDVRIGDASTVHIRGTIRIAKRVSPEAAERKIRSLEDNPPIEQNGNSIRIGYIRDPDLRRHVSISYELVVPAATALKSDTGSGDQTITGINGPLNASTGSGNLHLAGVGGEVRANTGSGDIQLENLKGSVHAETGSGNIRGVGVDSTLRASTGSGDVRLTQSSPASAHVETGSGNIEVSGVHGALRLHTGSGNIAAEGAPEGDWRLDTGSGNVTARLPATAAFDLHAHTGSGEIDSDHPLTVQGKLSKHELRAKVRGGGYLLDVGTGSGDIRIQ
jgi:DUF4097 and DUF4098 domain-containing protein YvlB